MTKRINFQKEVRMDYACGTDNLRPAMQYIHFKDGFAYATDAHILVKNKIDDISNFKEGVEHLEGKFLHGENYSKIIQYYTVRILPDGFECWTFNGTKGAFFPFANVEHKFPNCDAVLELKYAQNEPIEKIGIMDANFVNIIKAMPKFSCGLVFNFKGVSKGIIVTANDTYYESIGIVMPMMINN